MKNSTKRMRAPVAVVLSGATTTKAVCQIYADYEHKIAEGQLYLIKTRDNRDILCRVDKITPYEEFYEPGDAWSEARRKRAPIPVDVSRKYTITELELLGQIGGRGLHEVTKPPTPGDEVFEISSEDLDKILGLSEPDAPLVRIGTFFGYSDLTLPLDLEALPMHMAIIGVTGSGKSYTAGFLIEELRDIEVGGCKSVVPIIVIDANGDYLDFWDEYKRRGKLGYYDKVLRFVFKGSSAYRYFKYIKNGVVPIKVDLDAFTPREVAELIITYYSGSLNELQVSGLETILAELKLEDYGLNEIFVDEQAFNALHYRLQEARDQKRIHPQTHSAICRALNKFREELLEKYEVISVKPTLSEELVDDITGESPSLVIIDFSADGATGVPLRLKQFVVSYLTKLLYDKFVSYKINGENRLLLLMIEEAQNYCPNLQAYPVGYSLARENVALIATQGRKFGLCLCLISQRPAFIDPIALSMVNTFIIHRVAASDVSFVKKLASLPGWIERKLTSLAVGRAVVVGQMNRLGFPVLVDIPKREIEPKMGKISVLEILQKMSRGLEK